MRKYYFIFEYTEIWTGIDKKSSHIVSYHDYFEFAHVLKKCSKIYARPWIITFFTELSQEEYDEYNSYEASL